jgi:hypothetical protein
MDHHQSTVGNKSVGGGGGGGGSSAGNPSYNRNSRTPRRRVEYEADDRLYESQSTPIPHWSKRVFFGVSPPEPPPELFGDRYEIAEPAHSPGEKIGFLATASTADEFGGSVPGSDIGVAAASSKRLSAAAAQGHGTAEVWHGAYASGPADDRRAASRALRLAAVFYCVPAVITVYGLVLLLKVSAQSVEKDIEEAFENKGDEPPDSSDRRALVSRRELGWEWLRRAGSAGEASASGAEAHSPPPPPIIFGGLVILLLLGLGVVAIARRMFGSGRQRWQRRRVEHHAWSAVKGVDVDDLAGRKGDALTTFAV